MSNFPDDFAANAPGSPFAPGMSVQALRFTIAAGSCQEHLDHIGDLLSAVLGTDHETVDDFDVDRLHLVLRSLQEATRHMQEVERNHVV